MTPAAAARILGRMRTPVRAPDLRAACHAALLAVVLASAGCRERTTSAPRATRDATAAPVRSRAAPVPPPPLDDACTTDADCGRGTFAEDCCAHCYFVAGSKDWISRMDRHCRGPGYNPACPTNDCPIQMADPRCVAGHCKLVPR